MVTSSKAPSVRGSVITYTEFIQNQKTCCKRAGGGGERVGRSVLMKQTEPLAEEASSESLSLIFDLECNDLFSQAGRPPWHIIAKKVRRADAPIFVVEK